MGRSSASATAGRLGKDDRGRNPASQAGEAPQSAASQTGKAAEAPYRPFHSGPRSRVPARLHQPPRLPFSRPLPSD